MEKKMDSTILQGIYWVYIGTGSQGLGTYYRGYLGLMEKKLEAAIMGLYRAWGCKF